MKINTSTQEMLDELDKLDAERFMCMDVINLMMDYINDPTDYPYIEYNEEIDKELTELFGDFDWFSEEQLPIIKKFLAVVFLKTCEKEDIEPVENAAIEDDMYFKVLADLQKVCSLLMPLRKYEPSIMNEPYIKKVLKLPKNHMYGKKHIDTWVFYPYEMFFDMCSKEEDYKFKQMFGYGEKRLKFPIIAKGRQEIHIISPFEILRTKRHMEEMKGNVVVLGSELGYAVNMMAGSDKINKIIVVEEDKNVADIFEKELLPLIENQQKITFIRNSWNKYLSEMPDDIDYVFVHDTSNAIRYIELLRIEKKSKVKFLYSDEDENMEFIKTILALLVLIEVGWAGMDWEKNGNPVEIKIKDMLLEAFKDINIETPKNLQQIFTRSYLRNLLAET